MSKSAVNPIPTGMHSVTPHLVCADAQAAMDFYVKAFGASIVAKLDGPDGRLMHGEIKIGDSMIMIAAEYPEYGSRGPKALGGTPVTLHMYVEDADQAFAKAVAAGATAKMPVADMFWGDRYGIVEDPYGHQWSLATHVRDLSPEEIAKGAAEAFKDGPCAAKD